MKYLLELTNNRWSKLEKNKIQICMAKLLQIFNHRMGGVDFLIKWWQLTECELDLKADSGHFLSGH